MKIDKSDSDDNNFEQKYKSLLEKYEKQTLKLDEAVEANKAF